MNYLEELKKYAAAIDSLSNEQEQLIAKKKELIAAYEEADMHPGISKQVPDFAAFVAQELSK